MNGDAPQASADQAQGAHADDAQAGSNNAAPGTTGGGAGSGEADAELIAQANRLFSGPVSFLKSAPSLQFLPDGDIPEIAFAGRSNVGKSTLINALTGRKGLARSSVTPGRTQELNFFDVGEPPQFRITDMPGYGYAKAPLKVVQRWRYLINDYLRGRAKLKRTLLLIDARRGIGAVDREVMKMLDEAAVSYQITLTKADKIRASELEQTREACLAEARQHPAAFPELIVTSAETRGGIDQLRAAVLAAVRE